MKVFIFILFLVNIFYNFSLKRKNLISVKLERKFLFIICLFALIVLFITYRFSSKYFLDFLLALASIVLLFSIISSPGIRADGFNIFMGSTTLIKFLPFDKIKNIEINYSDDDKTRLREYYDETYAYFKEIGLDEIQLYKILIQRKNKIENLIAKFL